MSLTKKEIAVHIAEKHDLSQAAANRILDTVASLIQREVKKGNGLVLPGVGRFSVTKRAARTGRNPQTGAAIKIAAKKVVKFAPALVLRVAAAGKGKK